MKFDDLRQWVFLSLAVISLICGLSRATGAKEVDRETLYFLIAAGVFLVLERVKKFSLTKDGISYELDEIRAGIAEVNRRVSDVRDVAKDNQLAITGGIGQGVSRKSRTLAAADGFTLPPAGQVDPDDPQKGRFGGNAAANDRELTARVRPAPGNPGFFRILLEVRTKNSRRPLTGVVEFHLHDTFPQPVRSVTADGTKATLQLLAYGAFTVGVVADKGETLLELDLSENPDFPADFREN